ncbi:PH and SEC7 domain-containing protein 1 [Dunckerocampus dactyliophorus]|uniref:PH and SEC7 domain-containing protein 1 n=1 Tax=Dunckerocampus dactyliophorus TaxID=161453 RepID=UPI002405CD29|nr:PH and SEC7 domain-containing protein 1 [Dunckerocampus dactyliophorus]XP_054612876.1 PH and SEC7 domain-containing protein 1 [Dunckerocampus dactyliophorus]XP_054612877.1 PH and SEC7 domain-containing protein 1 [Dunckerocampus dactyliophorus]XP_054612878.1 PH and SEC7 domain-containing protein 1 [Dunckerocampus dactyliophorus]XP_054612880.1 PH and SEC7 domain-containing protein 1 [Dunckerocampus dactyliophorus]XP_054612881.1 PH and SEC7 domain-containing protein 1 [Dunckerocampus dactyliop
MEEEYLRSPCVDLTAPLRHSWSSKAQQHLNGEAKSEEERVDEWEQTIWPTRPLHYAAAALSFATVQWEIPDAAAETRSLTTDGNVTSALDSVTSCLPLRNAHDDEEEVERREKQNGFDSSVNSKCTGSSFKPCDAAVGCEPMTQQREHSTHQRRQISYNAVALKSDSEEEGEGCVTSNAVASVDLCPEEPREETDAALTGHADSAGDGQTSFQDGKMAEWNKKSPGECLSDTVNVEVPTRLQNTDDNGPTFELRKVRLTEATSQEASVPGDGDTEMFETSVEEQTEPHKSTQDIRLLEQTQTNDTADWEGTVRVGQLQHADGLAEEKVSIQPGDSTELADEEQENQTSQPATSLIQNKGPTRAKTSHEAQEVTGTLNGSVPVLMANGETSRTSDDATPHMNGGDVDREMARHLAERLFKLDGVQRVDVVKHLDKDNAFSHAVGEEYLRFFDFTGQTLDQALRSFLKVVILLGETQERERVLQHFTGRFHQCNPDSFSSQEAVLALACALMLLNTDLHGQNVGKTMSTSKFVSNLDGMNDGENFSKELLKCLYNSIKSEPLEWAVDEEELASALMEEDVPLRSKSNPFQDVPHDKAAPVVKQGFLQRKLHADIDGKRTPWGKRRWKTFYGVLKGMVLFLQKDHSRKEQQANEEVVSVHHSLAEPAVDYTKKPYVFRLQTADWRVFLFQASSKMEMISWINRINLVSALHSSPPFPAAVGSQRRFCRPILPASQSAHTLERQLQSHSGMLESFKADLSYLQQNPPEGRKGRGREMEEHRTRAEYLQHEICRYENYICVLQAWKGVQKTGDGGALINTALGMFDNAICASPLDEEEDEATGHLTKSHSSPSLELEMAPPSTIKVRRNISERWTYRRTITPRLNKDA